MAMRSHPSSGPRAGRNNISHRGGIRKRGQHPARVDTDGDLDMDSNGAGRGRGRGRGGRRHNTPIPQTNGHGNPFKDTRKTKLDLSAVQRGVFRAMGGADSGPRGRGVSSRLGKTVTGRNNHSARGLDQIVIRGLQQSKAAANADGGLEALVSWLERKATVPGGEAVRVKKSRPEGNDVIISVRSEDITSIIRLNNYQFAGANLSIDLYQQGKAFAKDHTVSAEAAEVKALLLNALSRRYNQDMKLLDLSKLGEDSELVSSGLLDTHSRISKLFPALMGVCDEQFENQLKKSEAVVSISLANNNLFNLEHVFKLAKTFPNIKNLDLSNNQFKNVHALEKWRFEFPQLEHLVVSGNPIENGDPSFMSSLMERYPKLRKLETTPGLPTKEVQVRRNTGINMPVAPPDFRDDSDISKNFIIRFFPAFDTNRQLLLNEYYDNDSLFSINVNTQSPREQTTTTPHASWDQYIKSSRNLLKINHTRARMNRLAKGSEKIRALWNTLPATRHADLKSEPEKWCIECHSIVAVPDKNISAGVGGLIITAHGEYIQEDGMKRSFDRTIVLGPGAGSGGVRVVSDMMTVRAYGGYEAWVPNSTTQVPQLTIPSQTNQQIRSSPAPIPALPDDFGRLIEGKTPEQLTKETMAMELTSRTHMTIEYSGLCLAESGWDLENAYRAFEGAKAQLPQEAFLPF